MLGLRPACSYQEVAIEYNKSLNFIHPDQCFLDGAAEAFMKLQPAYTEWNAARARQVWIHPTAASSAPVNSDSRHPNNRPSSHSEGRGGLGARPPMASQSGMPGFPQQRTGAESAPSGSNLANVPQNAGINPEPAHDSIFRHLISSLNPDDPSVTWINPGALDFLSRLERDGRLFELRAFTSLTATDLNDIQRSLFKDCVKQTLTMAGRFEHEKRACEALRQLARTLPLLLLTHSKMEIRAACNKFLKGEWESPWDKCMAKGHARQDKLAANPLSASSRTSAQKHAMAQKQARAGNLSKANQTVCSVLKPTFGHDTLYKLQEKTPVGSVVFDKQFWPTTDALAEMRRHDEWLNVQEHSFSIKKIGQYFRTCKPLSAQDADGWRGREHIGWLFSDGDSAFQELLRTHLILPNILGDFLADSLDEIAGGRMFALEKANNSLRPIVIGSLCRRCAARLGVAEVRSNEATFFHVAIHEFHSIWRRIGWGHSMRTSHSALSGSMGSTSRRESSCRDST